MIGGSMKMTSRFALVAAAGLLVGATVAPAKAADLGGGCCADLEERVAELEATVARKGNRVVSLQVYGQVNKALLIWDDGIENDAYVVDNDYSGSRVGFKGSATMKPGWTAGFNIEIDIQDSATNQVDQGFVNGDEGNDNEIAIRHNYLYIESEQLGRLSIGQQSTATDGVNEIVLGGSLAASYDFYGSFQVRQNGATDDTTGLKISNFVSNLDGPRDDVVRYDSPSIYGFIVSAAWGDDDYADLAVRFKKEWNSIRIAAGVGYQWDDRGTDSTEIFSGSVSVMHVPTGIYGAFAAGSADKDSGNDADFWYAQLGIEKRFLPYGSTTLYGEYGDYNGFADDKVTLDDQLVFDSEAEIWGFGVVQKFDSAALEVYGQYRHYSFDIGDESVEDFDAILLGSRIKF